MVQGAALPERLVRFMQIKISHGALRFTHQKIFTFPLRNSPRIEAWVVNRKVNHFRKLLTGCDPPEKIPGRRNKPY
jgi:hypothetical protein